MQSQSANIALIKSHLLPYQTENIILAAKLHLTVQIFKKHKICPLNKTICNYQCQIYKTKSLFMSILKKEYMIIPIIPIGAYLYIYTKTTLLITLLAKNIAGKIFTITQIQKRE